MEKAGCVCQPKTLKEENLYCKLPLFYGPFFVVQLISSLGSWLYLKKSYEQNCDIEKYNLVSLSWAIVSVVRPLKAERNDLQCSLWTYIEALKDCFRCNLGCRCLFSAVGILLSCLFHFLILGLQGPFPFAGSISDNLSLSVPDLHATICLMGVRIELILFKSIYIDYLVLPVPGSQKRNMKGMLMVSINISFNKMGNGTTTRQTWRKGNSISGLSPLRLQMLFWGIWDQLWCKNGFNIPKWENSPAPKASLPVQPRKIPFINTSNTLKNMAFNSQIPKLWSYTDTENLFDSWKSRKMPTWWWKRQESCWFTGLKIFLLEQWSTAFQGIWIKQELWTKITLCLMLASAVVVAASGFQFFGHIVWVV